MALIHKITIDLGPVCGEAGKTEIIKQQVGCYFQPEKFMLYPSVLGTFKTPGEKDKTATELVSLEISDHQAKLRYLLKLEKEEQPGVFTIEPYNCQNGDFVTAEVKFIKQSIWSASLFIKAAPWPA